MKITHILTVGLLCGALAACGKVPAGNVGVKVDLYGSDKGVSMEELGPGRYWVGMNEDLYIFPTFTQNYVWTQDDTEGSPNDESIKFQTIEGMTVGADVGISYSVDPAKVSLIFQKYRKGIDEITGTYLRNMVRDALVSEGSTREIESVYGSGKTALMRAVEDSVRAQVEPIGINIERVYWIGELRLPDTVVTSLNAKIEATQKAQQRANEVQQSIAEAKKKIEEARGEAESIKLRAQATAEANAEIAKSLTPELVKFRAIERWDGVLPRMTGDGAVPFIDVTKDASK
ncbi:SPFH domain-containing protein [uncultured Cohaesibacter sp.]|uniref:SPFH domain-containing protein n=1 Tax=uncultured Cohaesibacter sp. TaxID=1002546 RepID=UPI0029C85C0B|nr:SPFH domain-containing protein [uncultured Cohaesibacter sp.]